MSLQEKRDGGGAQKKRSKQHYERYTAKRKVEYNLRRQGTIKNDSQQEQSKKMTVMP